MNLPRSVPRTLLTLFAIVSISAPLISSASITYHWEDRFTQAEQRKLQSWIGETHQAVERLVGEPSFQMHIYFHRARAREPVPWAHTERSARRQGVHFYVDPSYSLRDLRRDWTAAHEISHLILPYVGRSNSWFAEGFASFMQYQVMNEMGVLSNRAMEQRYLSKLRRAERNYRRHRNRAFANAATRLRSEGKYPTMYWGGAAYFLQVNDALIASSDTDLVGVLRQYMNCCRVNRSGLDRLVRQLDQVGDSTIFAEKLSEFRSKPGFPAFESTISNAVK